MLDIHPIIANAFEVSYPRGQTFWFAADRFGNAPLEGYGALVVLLNQLPGVDCIVVYRFETPTGEGDWSVADLYTFSTELLLWVEELTERAT